MWISYATFDVILILTYIIRQYYALNALTERYADKPFKILGFPCNQFLRQVITKSMTRNMSGVL